MAISILDAVNACLATRGELPLNSLDDLYGYGQTAYFLVLRHKDIVLGRGWWFNTYRNQLLIADSLGHIDIPGDAYSGRPALDTYRVNAQGRVELSYYPFTSTFDVGHKMYVTLVKQVDWDDIPMVAREYIAASAVEAFLIDYDASTLRYQQAVAAKEAAKRALLSEHMKLVPVNLLRQGPGGLARHRAAYGRHC